eukprot:5271750-Amphidinium_carterae.3
MYKHRLGQGHLVRKRSPPQNPANRFARVMKIEIQIFWPVLCEEHEVQAMLQMQADTFGQPAALTAATHTEPEQKKNKSGTGGAWRAFVHMESKGTHFTAEGLKGLGVKYRRLTPEEKEPYKQMGKAATLCGKVGMSTFPIHSRQVLASRGCKQPGLSRGRKQIIEKSCSHFQDREEMCQVCVLGLPCQTPPEGHDGDVLVRPRNEQVHAQRLEQQALSGRCCHFPQLQPPPDASANIRKTCKKQLDSALLALCREQKTSNKQQEQNEGELEQKCASEAKHTALDILDQRLGLKNIPHCCWISPPQASLHGAGECRKLLSCFDSSTVACVAHNVCENVETVASNVSVERLAADWRRRHECIPHTSRPQPSKSLTSRCFQLGVCTCRNTANPRRAWLQKLIEKASQHIKRLQRSTNINKELKNGELILRWRLTETCAIPEQSAAAAMSSTDTLRHPPPNKAVEKWTHIALHYQTPWSPTLIELSVAPGEEPPPLQFQIVAPANLKLQACELGQSLRVFTLWEWLDHIVGKDTVEVELWQLSQKPPAAAEPSASSATSTSDSSNSSSSSSS